MKISKLLMMGLLLLAMACSNEKETPKGYKYTVIKSGNGTVVKPGEFLKLNLLLKDGKDSIWSDTKKGEIPFAVIRINPESEKINEEGFEEVLRMLSNGDSVEVKIPAKVFFEKNYGRPLPPQIDSASNFIFYLGVTDILDSVRMMKLEQEVMAAQMAKQAKQVSEQLAKDTVLIDNFLKEKAVAAQTTPSGLRYVVTKAGKGPTPVSGQSVKIQYKGYLLDGKVFDTSIESVARENNVFQEGRPYEPYTVQVGMPGQVIAGWDEAITLMNKGSKMTFYIPSTLGYGPRGSGIILENSILVFDLEMVDIK